MPAFDTPNGRIEFSGSQIASWCLGLGGVLAVLGILAIAAPWVASTVIDYLCAGTLIAAGISQLGMAAGGSPPARSPCQPPRPRPCRGCPG
jgi:uncharacterized membrane protein HdeD (DUF308 family)